MWSPYASMTAERLRALIAAHQADIEALRGTENSAEISEYHGPAIAELERELRIREHQGEPA